MQIQETISRTHKDVSEDAFGYREDGVWVIDGATPLEPGPLIDGVNSAAWLSHTASDLLRDVPWDGLDLPDVLARVIEQLAERGAAQGLTASAFPTAAISLVRQVGRHLEVCSLGDCTVLVGSEDTGVVEILDPQFVGAEERLLDRVRDRIAAGLTPAQAYQEMQSVLLQRRRERNGPSGLWVLSADPDAAWHAFHTSVAVPTGTDLVVMSDGYARVLWPFRLVSDAADLFGRVVRGEAAGLAERLDAVESADPGRTEYLRFSVHDDVTMVRART